MHIEYSTITIDPGHEGMNVWKWQYDHAYRQDILNAQGQSGWHYVREDYERSREGSEDGIPREIVRILLMRSH